MKGISTILAMILIVIIVVALIGLTYTFAVGLFSTTTAGATEQTAAVTKRLDQSVTFLTDPTCTNYTSDSWVIKFTIKHTGATYNIESDEIDALVGNDPFVINGFGTTMAPGETKYLNITNNKTETNIDWSGTQTLTISVPATPVTKTVNCPTI